MKRVCVRIGHIGKFDHPPVALTAGAEKGVVGGIFQGLDALFEHPCGEGAIFGWIVGG